MFSKVLVSLLFAGMAAALCPPGYSSVNGKCYSVPGLPERYTWWEVADICSLAYSDVFIVKTAEEWTDLNNFLVGLGYYDTYWAGVTAQGHPGQWVNRANGLELDQTAVSWKAGYPSGDANNLCLAIEYQPELGVYQWLDQPCSTENLIVCQPKVCLF